MVLIVFGIAVLLVLPALALLYTLAQRDMVAERRDHERAPERGRVPRAVRGAAQLGRVDGAPGARRAQQPRRRTGSWPRPVWCAAEMTVTLSLPLSTEARPDSPQPADYRMTMMPDEDIGLGSVRFAKDYIGADYHNEGHTHIDAFSHVSYEGRFYGGAPDTLGDRRRAPGRARSTCSRTA